MKYIYTCITGGKDELCDEIETRGAKLVCFTDDPTLKSNIWEIRVLPDVFKDVRRNSRLAKMLPHIYMPDATYSLYVDANIINKVPIQKIIDNWLQDTDIALFRHNTRDCLFDEADECIRLELDDIEVIKKHKERYKGFPEGKGLYQGGVILRRHTPKMKQFNEMWFSEYCAGSKRDQISLPYCIEKLGISINAIESHAFRHPYLEQFNHKILSEWAGKV
jgi:hypothetical protein